MRPALRVFVSSVQKELEDERLIVQNLLNTDPFLSAHCFPVLYEFEPASPDTALEGCLKSLDTCQVYLLIVGLNRVRLDEYPVDGLREALVNAVAHRQYEDAGRKILLEIFADRVVLSSPGLPPKPITLASLRKGKYRPCSRNPVLAQCLSYFHRIEERGSGFRRMHDEMLDHGLDHPLLGADTGYFQITFPGPGDNIERLRVPETRLFVTPAVEARLNERQRTIMAHALEMGAVATGWCMEEFEVARDTAHRDLVGLVKLGLLAPRGAGRGADYVPGTGSAP